MRQEEHIIELMKDDNEIVNSLEIL